MDIWGKLYNEAIRVQNARVISPFIEAGGVAAALLTKHTFRLSGGRKNLEKVLTFQLVEGISCENRAPGGADQQAKGARI